MNKLYSRTDLYLTSQLTLQSFESAHIELIAWSDHTPPSIRLTVSPMICRLLNSSLLIHLMYQELINNRAVHWNAHKSGILIKQQKEKTQCHYLTYSY